MDQDDLRQILKAVPFKPMRMHLSDGSAYDIRHPEQCIVFFTRLGIAVQEDEEADQSIHWISLIHITRLVPLG